MRRCSVWLYPGLILLGLLATALLSAQPQILPPVEIGSETSLKAPLAKKALVFPEEAEPDSLPAFGPWNLSLRHEPPVPNRGRIHPLYLKFGADTGFGSWLQLKHYPTWRFLPRLAMDAQLGVPGGNRVRSDVAGEFQTRFSPAFILSHQALYHAASADSFSARLLSYTLSNRARSLRLGKLTISELTTLLSVDDLKQELDGLNQHDRDFGLEHQQRLQWDRYGLLNGLWLQGDAVGLTLRYQLPDRGDPWPELSLGLMSDFQRLLPAIGLHSRFVLKPDLILEANNRPEIKAWSLSEQRQLHPWSAADLKDRLTLAPLNLALQAYALGGRDAIFQLARLRHSSRFLYNQPQIVALPSGQTVLRPSELLHNQTRLELRLRLWGFSLEQSVALNLEHEPDSAWRRRPYSPLFTAASGLSAELGKASLNLSLLQQYRQHDQLGRKLPEVHDLSLGLDYPLSPELRLSAGLDNLLDSRYSLPGDLPRPRRGFRISFQYLPLR